MLNWVQRFFNGRAALLLALIYVSAVLMPSVANAFSHSKANHHHSQQVEPAGKAAHAAKETHDHKHHSDNGSAPHSHDNKLADLKCCGLACISALPACFVQFGTPASVVTALVLTSAHKVTSRATLPHYRPPIA
jgi:hypothetical protein